MNIDELKQAIHTVTQNKGVPFITAQPGVGKSDSVKQYAESRAKDLKMDFYEGPENYNEDSFGFVDLRLATIDSIDLNGLPLIDKGAERTKFTRSPYIPKDGHGVLFLDELPQAKAGNQAAISQLILDRRVGSHALGDNWVIIAAGNRAKDRAATHKMPTHIANRLTFLELDFSIDTFANYMIEQNVDPSVMAFAKYRPDLLESFKPDNDVNCTPRSFMAAAAFVQAPKELQFPLLAGTIGEGATAEFLGFMRIYKNLPPIEKFIKEPMKVKIPKAADILYATVQKLSHHVDETTVAPLNMFISRLEESPEYIVMFWKNAIRKNKKLLQEKVFQDFLAENKDLVL